MATAGGYQIVRKLATGGMAELWLARTTGPDPVEVAIKRILPQHASDREFVQMFLDEARIAASLRHPNVVRMHEVGSDAGTYFIVMEYLDGENVRSVVRQLRSLGRPMLLEHAVAIVLGTAAGLHYAHEHVGTDGRPLRIVHRDVSPQNILVTRDGAVKLVDFGIAKAAHRVTETRAGTMKGKVPYMSPEQCNGEALDRRSDVWALGAVLYELTVGRRMIRRAPDYLMMKQITEEPVTPPSALLPMYPRDLEAVLLKALSPRRGQRYQTMADFAAEVRHFAEEHRLDLRPTSLASMMREAFGGGPTALPDFEDERATTEEEPAPAGALPEVKPRSVAVTWAPGPDSPPRKAPQADARAPAVARRRVGPIEVVAISGRLTEAFRGAEVGATLRGDVVLDLSGVERVTSFGVREWLAMNAAASVTSLYLDRCTEPIVNQLTMIRGFSGPGRVLSFLAPYVCTGCGTAFQRLVDAEADAEAVRAQVPPPAACPTCGGEGRFDDDPRSYFAIASLLAEQVPAAVRAATGPVSPVGRPALEKRVEGDLTTLVVNLGLTPSLRWRNALEGVDGRLLVDLANVATVEAGGARSMLAALRAVRSEVRSVELEGAPVALSPDLQAERWVLVRSWRAEAACGTCGRTSPVVVPADRMADAARGRWSAACACGGSLRPPLDALGAAAPAAATAEPARQELPTLTAATSAPPVAAAAEPSPPSFLGVGVGVGLAAAGVLAILASLLAIGAIGLVAGRSAPPPEPPAVVEPVPAPELVPWTVGADGVIAVARGSGATVEEAAAAARQEAMRLLVKGALAEVPRAPDGDADPDPDAAVERYLAAFGAIGTPERRDLRVERPGPPAEVVASYALSRAAFDDVIGRLTPIDAGPLRLAPPLPVEAWTGLRVLASSDPEVPVGARRTAVDGRVLGAGGAPGEQRGARRTRVTGTGEERSVRLP